MKIEALHEFHNEEFSKEWSKKFIPTPERLKLFDAIYMNVSTNQQKYISILELGIGPGFLAEYLLNKLDNVSYEGLDFSKSMLKIASMRTAKFKEQVSFTKADLLNDNWTDKLKKKPNIVVSTWTIHDLFHTDNIYEVYKSVYKILPKSGILLNGNFIKPEESNHEYEGGRIRPSDHIKIFQSAGFKSAKCLEIFEKDIKNPTTANNYACFKAIK